MTQGFPWAGERPREDEVDRRSDSKDILSYGSPDSVPVARVVEALDVPSSCQERLSARLNQ